MDNLIKRWDATQDADLMLCLPRGVAYQRQMHSKRVVYDQTYLAKIDAYDHKIEAAVNAGRCALVSRHAIGGAKVLDWGAGSGSFVRAARTDGYDAKGFDVIPIAAINLTNAGLFADSAQSFGAVTLWDAIEHLEDPQNFLRTVTKGALVFSSVPIFDDLTRVRESKHYRPGEHLYYWTDAGFVDWMALHGFRLLERSAHEIEAGREQIGAYAFRKDLPDYNDHIGLYDQMHSTRHYGSSATELHLATVADAVKFCAPASILDYGCGRSDLVGHFWNDGKRRIARYDPAIPAFKAMPEGRFDLALCTDVLEHIPMDSVDRVLSEVRSKSDRAFFSISTKLARAKLPDGRNAHVTLLTRTEWTRWVAEALGSVIALPAKYEHELLLLAGEASSLRAVA